MTDPTRLLSDLAAFTCEPAHMLATAAALHRADQADPLTASREVPEGSGVCHECDRVHEEGDLARFGGDGDPLCVRCIEWRDPHYKELRLLLEQAVAVLAVLSETQTAQRIVNEARNLLDGE